MKTAQFAVGFSGGICTALSNAGPMGTTKSECAGAALGRESLNSEKGGSL